MGKNMDALVEIELNPYLTAMFSALLDKEDGNETFTKRDIFKIANLHPDCFNVPTERPEKEHKNLMRQIYKAIDDAGFGAFVPRDFRNFSKE